MEIELTSRRLDIVGEGFDLAIRASLAVEPNLIVRRLATSPVTLTASPVYLERRGVPQSPDELLQHDIVHHSGLKAGALWVMRRGEEERRPRKLAGLRFVFAPYQVGPYSDGTQTVEVPADVLLPHIAPAYRSLFVGG